MRATNGMELKPDRGIRAEPFCPTVIVVVGNEFLPNLGRAVRGWLRRFARHGVTVGAIDRGVFALAEAGLLGGVTVAVRCEAIPLLRQRFPTVDVVERLWVIERNRLTPTGGEATVAWMLELM